MDGFESNDRLDPESPPPTVPTCSTRAAAAGRFDRRVVVSRPTCAAAKASWQVHTRKIPLSEDVDIQVLARATPGFSGADLANLVNEAALLAARRNQKFVMMADFESSKDKVLMGAERKSMIITDEEKKVTAYHEAGHALLAALLPDTDPLHKVTIIPRGMALGVTQQLPHERSTTTQGALEGAIAVCMGGRIAETMTFGQILHGRARTTSSRPRRWRARWLRVGMSEALGPLTYGRRKSNSWARSSPEQDYSEATALKTTPRSSAS